MYHSYCKILSQHHKQVQGGSAPQLAACCPPWPAPPVIIAQQGRHPLQQVVGQLAERGRAAGGHVAGVDRPKSVMSEQPSAEVVGWLSSSEEASAGSGPAR